MYQLDPQVLAALHEYRREQLMKVGDVGAHRVARDVPRVYLAWPPWPARAVRRRRIAHQGA